MYSKHLLKININFRIKSNYFSKSPNKNPQPSQIKGNSRYT